MKLLMALALLGAVATTATPPPPTYDGAEAAGAAQLAHGNRLLSVLDCRGCHGQKLTGWRFINRPAGAGVIWASNLTHITPKMSEADLRALLTRGVHPGRGDLWVMPAQVYQHLSDADLAAIIAALRTLTPAGEPTPAPVLGPAALRTGGGPNDLRPAVTTVGEQGALLPVDAGRKHRLGRYIATTACTVCHGPQLEGKLLGAVETPDLIVAGAYSRTEFETLMTTGVPPDGRKLHFLMRAAATENAAFMTVAERDALHAYLVARAVPAE